MDKIKNIYLISFGIVIFLMTASNSFSKEYHVSNKAINLEFSTDQSETIASIQQAINSAFDGDTIRVAAGVYDQDLLIINKSIVLLGCQVGISPKSTLNRIGGECVILNSLEPFNSIVINAPNVVIDGFKFGMDDDQAINSIYINAPNVILRNCVIVNTNSCGVYISANAANSEVSYNHVEKSAFEGIFNAAESVQILSNYISNINEFSAISTSQKTIIKGNIISNIPENGIKLLQQEAILSLVYGNEITNTGQSDVYYDGQIPEENNKLSIGSQYKERNMDVLSIFKPKADESMLSQSSASKTNSMVKNLDLRPNNAPLTFSLQNGSVNQTLSGYNFL